MVQLILTLFGFYGVISNDTTWSDTVFLTGDVLVEPGVTLTIAPGTVVLYADTCEWDTAWYVEGENYPETLEGSKDIVAEGNVKILGTIEDSIYFLPVDSMKRISGNIIMSNSTDSLFFVSFDLDPDYFTVSAYHSELTMASCRFEHWNGIEGFESDISLFDCMFYDNRSNCVSAYKGKLRIEDCDFSGSSDISIVSYFENYPSLYPFGSIVYGENLECGIIKGSRIYDAFGYSPFVLYSGLNCAGCGFFNCEQVEVSNCAFDDIRGGSGGNESMGASPGNGGDGLGICIIECKETLIAKNEIANIAGGRGGIGQFEDGLSGSSRSFLCYNSKPVIVNNEFNSEGTYIYIDSLSHPVIGGAPGAGNHFLKAGNRRYVIHNDSPYDIDATWNFWECEPFLIDSLIYDHYDNPSKGVVHYDHATGIEEEEVAPSPESFSIASTVVREVLYISLPKGGGPSIVELYDSSGRRVMTKSVSQTNAGIDVSWLPKGIYFVKLVPEERANRFKILII